MHLDSVLLQHVQQRRLARIVEAQEQDLGTLVVQACQVTGEERMRQTVKHC